MQQRFRLLIFLIQPYMFRATNSPILRSSFFYCIYSFWYNAPTVAGRCHGRNGVPSQPWHRSAAESVYCTKSCIYSKKKCSWGWVNLSPETCRVDLKWIINENLLHIVGPLHRCSLCDSSNYLSRIIFRMLGLEYGFITQKSSLVMI